MKTSEQIDAIATAIVSAQAEIEAAPKDKVNPHFKSRYADLSSVWDACKKALGKYSIAVIQCPSTTPERYLRMTTRLLHKSGQWIENELDLKPMKDDPQAMGSAITYARRYALSSMLGVVSDEDDDGNAASAGRQKAAPQPPRDELFNRANPDHLAKIIKIVKAEHPDMTKELFTAFLDKAGRFAMTEAGIGGFVEVMKRWADEQPKV